MPTILGHLAAAVALGTAFEGPSWPRRAYLVGAVCSVLPDLDVIGLYFGVPYGSPFGHRGFSHSLLAAGLLAALATYACFQEEQRSWRVFVYLTLATASHGMLDALTSGGLGIGFFEPFEHSRRFFPWRPIRVSPLALSRILSARFWTVLASELQWIVVPAVGFGLVATFLPKCVGLCRESRET
jgi:inner membrane protein